MFIYQESEGGCVVEEVYHVRNCANTRVQIFDTDADYFQFENILKAKNFTLVVTYIRK